MQNISVILFTIVWALIAAYLFLHWFIILRIKYKHKAIWELLGKPGIYYYNKLKGRKAWNNYYEYIKNRKDKELGDNKLSKAIIIINKANSFHFNYVAYGFVILFLLYYLSKYKLND
jgi:hypothetical protein